MFPSFGFWPSVQIKVYGKVAAATTTSMQENVVAAATTIVQQHSFVQLMFVNSGYIEMTKNWLCNVRGIKQGVVAQRTLIVATDRGAFNALSAFRSSATIVYVGTLAFQAACSACLRARFWFLWGRF